MKQPEKVKSDDGTSIAYWSSGSGPPLVMVHGTSTDHTSFRFLTPLLEDHFTVHIIDRRGRGDSGDSDEYSIDREFEDIAAVVNSIKGSVSLFGHSFGATVALGAALHTENLHKLILYEPAAGLTSVSEERLSQLEKLLEEGEREELLTTFYREFAGMSQGELKKLKDSQLWPMRLKLANTIPRELRNEESLTFDPEQFKDFYTPTLLLLGDESPKWAHNATHRVKEILPNSSIHILMEQSHVAIITAPKMVESEITQFLSGDWDN